VVTDIKVAQWQNIIYILKNSIFSYSYLESCLYIPLHTDAKINSASLLINLHQFKGFTNDLNVISWNVYVNLLCHGVLKFVLICYVTRYWYLSDNLLICNFIIYKSTDIFSRNNCLFVLLCSAIFPLYHGDQF
jgi:hypothetical protein